MGQFKSRYDCFQNYEKKNENVLMEFMKKYDKEKPINYGDSDNSVRLSIAIRWYDKKGKLIDDYTIDEYPVTTADVFEKTEIGYASTPAGDDYLTCLIYKRKIDLGQVTIFTRHSDCPINNDCEYLHPYGLRIEDKGFDPKYCPDHA